MEPKDRVPPSNIEAERSVLGAVLVNNSVLDQILEVGLEPQDFYRDANRRIFESMLSLFERRDPIDLISLSSLLKTRGVFDDIGGTGALTGLFDDAFAIGHVSHYAQIIKDKSTQRKMINACTEIIGQAFQGVEDCEGFVNEAETKVFGVSQIQQQGKLVELKKILLGNVATIEELHQRKSDVTGLSSGFRDFDKVTTGLHPGQVMVLAARPGMGKTSLLISMLQHVGVVEKKVAAFFSLEMSKEEIGFRFLSGLSRIDSRKLKTGKIDDYDWQKLGQAADQLAAAKIMVDDSGSMTVMDIRSRCRRLKASEKNLDLIVIDYLQLMKGSRASRGGDGSREREISEISRNLKELAKELRVPIIALSQLNRGVEQRQDKRPGLADLRESGAIEQDADIVCFIHRDDYYDRESEQRGIAELIVAKNRSGETSNVRLAWLGQYTLFANLAPDAPGTPITHQARRPEVSL